MTAPIKVVYIAGLGHSGSTLLGSLLGQLDGFFFVGEMASTARAFANGDLCGCGEPLVSCPTWSAILEAAFPAENGGSRSQLAIDRAEGRALGVVRQALRSHGLFPRAPRLDAGRNAYAAVLRAIGKTTGSRVVVDSSKWPGYGYLLDGIDGVDLTVVHLVRDPRAVVDSRLKSVARRGVPVSPGPTPFAAVWDVWNATVELLWGRSRYLRLRYEDLAREPAKAVRRIAALAGEPANGLRFVGKDTVAIAPTHTVAGNRGRFRTGEVRLRLDDEWARSDRLSSHQYAAVSALTWPLRLRYGYRRPRRQAGSAVPGRAV